MKFLEFEYQSHEKIWGEEKWIISAHDNGLAKIKNSTLNLNEYYRENRNLFGDNLPDDFPLLVKIINTVDDLSIQVHPDDEYAKANENSLGKCECWYILEANDTDIIAGQKKITREEVKAAITNNTVVDLFDLKEIKKGDFFYIPTGCVHAIRKNTSILEIQQSSDITYRLYDYNRKDNEGNLRELHIEKSLDVIDYDFQNQNQITKVDETTTNLVTCKYFYVDLIENKNEYVINTPNQFKMLIAIDGPMYVDSHKINQNEGIIILKDQEVRVKSDYKVAVSGITKEEK